MGAARLEQPHHALHVGVQERLGIGDGAVDVGLGGEVDHGVAPGHHRAQQRFVADVAHHELHPVLGEPGDVGGVARVGELVQHGHAHARALAHHPAHEVGPHEPAPAGDEDALEFPMLHYWPPHQCRRLTATSGAITISSRRATLLRVGR